MMRGQTNGANEARSGEAARNSKASGNEDRVVPRAPASANPRMVDKAALGSTAPYLII